jgi:hypothetical protein
LGRLEKLKIAEIYGALYFENFQEFVIFDIMKLLGIYCSSAQLQLTFFT